MRNDRFENFNRQRDIAHAKGPVVTVAVSNITFMEPIKAGDAVCCYTDVERVGQTSITLHVDVWVLRQGQGDRVKVTAAEFVFVAVNDNGRPRSVSSGSLHAIRSKFARI